MNKVNIVYYSFTGNTLRMVKAFEKGLQEANVPFKSYSVVELKDDNEAFDCEILALASPANQTEEIEKNYFQPFMKRNAEKFKDKKVYLFGTFGWGTGKFMGTWIKQVEELGAKIVELPMACKGSPNAETKEKLTNMAKKIATM
ncbi:flavodoxin domain-containing protein [Fusobacterium vincentii]|uniref:Flavodoxin n=1 Tax=Fusobacterium nucleatum 13_3C TaxID=1357398 RepID=X7RWT0_FUSNU|nr:flavodoxin domain-containing protein [Fusobacterium nucleatum]ETZ25177.1 flavodoxin [Fusobacterium nucleatum 13_3C]